MRIHTILVPTDFSDTANAALGWAEDLAQACGARVVLLHVVDLEYQWVPAGPAVVPTPVPAVVARGIRDHARTAIEALAPKSPLVGRRLVRSGHARDEILSAADEVEADIIVMGTHSRRGIEHLFIGSVAEYVVRHARVPVMTVRSFRRGRAR